MADNYDDLKGRAKESVGDVTGDEDMQREGKLDQAKGKAKEGVDRVGDAIKDITGKK